MSSDLNRFTTVLSFLFFSVFNSMKEKVQHSFFCYIAMLWHQAVCLRYLVAENSTCVTRVVNLYPFNQKGIYSPVAWCRAWESSPLHIMNLGKIFVLVSTRWNVLLNG